MDDPNLFANLRLYVGTYPTKEAAEESLQELRAATEPPPLALLETAYAQEFGDGFSLGFTDVMGNFLPFQLYEVMLRTLDHGEISRRLSMHHNAGWPQLLAQSGQTGVDWFDLFVQRESEWYSDRHPFLNVTSLKDITTVLETQPRLLEHIQTMYVDGLTTASGYRTIFQRGGDVSLETIAQQLKGYVDNSGGVYLHRYKGGYCRLAKRTCVPRQFDDYYTTSCPEEPPMCPPDTLLFSVADDATAPYDDIHFVDMATLPSNNWISTMPPMNLAQYIYRMGWSPYIEPPSPYPALEQSALNSVLWGLFAYFAIIIAIVILAYYGLTTLFSIGQKTPVRTPIRFK
jgi:hypothetical protein